MSGASPPLNFFIGGVRSGKSALAQRWAEAQAKPWLYLATCSQASIKDDPEMAARVQAHKEARADGWQTVEEPLELASALSGLWALQPLPGVILLDCLGLWLMNLLLCGIGVAEARESVNTLASVLTTRKTAIAVVSQETGLGLLPPNKLGRDFCDFLGLANQVIARASDNVLFVLAGLPLALKGEIPKESQGF